MASVAYNGFSPEHRSRAGRWLRLEREAGRRPPASKCMACGQTQGVIDYHSEDYSEPFGDNIGAYQFCYTCHLLWHGKRRRPLGWKAYCVALRAGAIFPPVLRRDLAALNPYMNEETVAAAVVGYVPPRIPMLFDQPPFTATP